MIECSLLSMKRIFCSRWAKFLLDNILEVLEEMEESFENSFDLNQKSK